MSELGSLLRKLRGKQSLREVSKKAGTSHTYLSIIEKGIDPRTGNPIKPTPETLRLLAKAYNYPYEEFMRISGYWNEPNDTTPPHEQDLLSAEHQIELEHVLLRADVAFKGRGLSDSERQRVLDMLSLLFHETIDKQKQD